MDWTRTYYRSATEQILMFPNQAGPQQEAWIYQLSINSASAKILTPLISDQWPLAIKEHCHLHGDVHQTLRTLHPL